MELPSEIQDKVKIFNQTTGVDGDPIPDQYTLSHNGTRIWMHLDYVPELEMSAYKLQWRSPLPLKDLAEILFDVGSKYSDEQPEVYGGSRFIVSVNGKSDQASNDMEVVRLDYSDHFLVAECGFSDDNQRVVTIQALEAPIFQWGALDLLSRTMPELPNPDEILQDIEVGRLAVLAHYSSRSV